jgi:hypothetical protein
MRLRTSLIAAATLAAGALLGRLASSNPVTTPVFAQEKKAEPGAKPEPLTPAQLAERTLHSRAVEAVIWGMPAVNFERMLQAAKENGAAPNQVVYWSRPVNWKDQTLTPNPDTIYFNPFYDTSRGPVVLEIPAVDGDASITGSVDDSWQNALDDVGPAGVDQGKGGKYLITPPGYKEKPPEGYIVLQSDTVRGFAKPGHPAATGRGCELSKPSATTVPSPSTMWAKYRFNAIWLHRWHTDADRTTFFSQKAAIPCPVLSADFDNINGGKSQSMSRGLEEPSPSAPVFAGAPDTRSSPSAFS